MHQPSAQTPSGPAICAGRMLPLAALALALALGVLSPPAQAQWKWRDQTGQINVSDRPPPKEVPQKDILSRPVPEVRRAAEPAEPASAASAPARPEARTLVDRELEARKQATDQEQAARQKAEADKAAANRADNCGRARGHVAALESGQRIARLNDKGEREVLDDKGRAEELRRAREIIASDCR